MNSYIYFINISIICIIRTFPTKNTRFTSNTVKVGHMHMQTDCCICNDIHRPMVRYNMDGCDNFTSYVRQLEAGTKHTTHQTLKMNNNSLFYSYHNHLVMLSFLYTTFQKLSFHVICSTVSRSHAGHKIKPYTLITL